VAATGSSSLPIAWAALRERDELLVVAGQRVGRQRLERLLQLGVAPGEHGLPLRARFPFAAQRRRGGRRLRLGLAKPVDREVVRGGQLVEPLHEPGPLGAQARGVGPEHRRGVGGGPRGLGCGEPGPGRQEEPHGTRAEHCAQDQADEQHGYGRGVH
jgi:hypothetical protein